MEYLFLTVSALVSLWVNGIGLLRRAPVTNILVFKLDHLGDIVTATPAFDYLRRTHPGAHITVVVGSWVAPILKGHPAIDELIEYDSPVFDRGDRSKGKPPLQSVLPKRRYDLVIGLRDDRASLRLSLTVGATRRRDRGTIRLLAKLPGFGRGKSAASPAGGMHEVETNLRIAGAGADADPAGENAVPSLTVREEDREWVKRELAGARTNGRRYVVLHPGAFSPLRLWPAERFAAVARQIRADGRFDVIVTGSAAEAPLAKSIAEMAGAGVHSLAGETSLTRVIAVIAGAQAMVSLDTGVMHIATAVGTPVVALVGPENPARFGPYGPGHVVIYHALSCSPCDQVHCVRASNECMELITVAQVNQALTRVLPPAPPSGPAVDRAADR